MKNPFKSWTTTKNLKKLASALGVLTKKDVLTFGKYNTLTVKQVMKRDPGYLCWIHDNTSHKLHTTVIAEARKKAAINNLSNTSNKKSYGRLDAYGDSYCEWEEMVDCGPFW